MNAGMGSAGLTRVWNSPSTSPPRTLTAPISVMPHCAGVPPVVSRSTTTNVTPARGVPRSSNVAWIACMTSTVCRGADNAPEARRSQALLPQGAGASRRACPVGTVRPDDRQSGRRCRGSVVGRLASFTTDRNERRRVDHDDARRLPDLPGAGRPLRRLHGDRADGDPAASGRDAARRRSGRWAHGRPRGRDRRVDGVVTAPLDRAERRAVSAFLAAGLVTTTHGQRGPGRARPGRADRAASARRVAGGLSRHRAASRLRHESRRPRSVAAASRVTRCRGAQPTRRRRPARDARRRRLLDRSRGLAARRAARPARSAAQPGRAPRQRRRRPTVRGDQPPPTSLRRRGRAPGSAPSRTCSGPGSPRVERGDEAGWLAPLRGLVGGRAAHDAGGRPRPHDAMASGTAARRRA